MKTKRISGRGAIEEPFGKAFAEKSVAQGAIEYLLIIGAAVIIAVIVIAVMMGLSGTGTGAVDDAGIDSAYSGLMGIRDKYEGMMVITLRFVGNELTEVVIPDVIAGFTLKDLFPNAPIGTEAFEYPDAPNRLSIVEVEIGNWNPNAELDEGERVTIRAPEDFEQEIDAKESDVILIYSCEGLQAISDLSGDYALGKSIDCGGTDFEPIGFDSGKAFSGTFNGNGFEIIQLNIVKEGEANIGLFGSANNASFSDISIVDAFLQTDYGLAGAFVGAATDTSFTGCGAMGTLSIGEDMLFLNENLPLQGNP